MLEIRVLPSARADMDDLDRPVFDRISRKIAALKIQPRPSGALKLRGAEEGWRVQIGDWRVLYRIDDARQIVFIYRVKHRREAYR